MASNQQSGPSQDAIASLITQVSPTGQPARAPARPNRPRQGTAKRTPSNTAGKKVGPASSAVVASPNSPTSTSSPTVGAIGDNLSSQAAPTTSSSSDQNNNNVELNEIARSGRANDDTLTTEEAKDSYNASTSANSANELPLAATSSANVPSSAQPAGNAAAPSTSAATGAPTQQQQKKKRKGFLASIFGSCMSGSSHDDDTAPQQQSSSGTSMTERKPGQANATRPGQITNKLQKSPSGSGATGAGTGVALVDLNKGKETPMNASTTGTASTGATAVATATAAEMAIRNALAAEKQGTQPGAIPPSPSMLSSSTLGGGAAAQQHPPSDIAPEVLAATQHGGAALPRDETADVLSGAVQAPGSEGLTPKKEKRRKSSGEVSSMAMQSSDSNAALGDESHVSSASSAADEALEDSEDDEYMDEDERLIAQGGIGIPLDEYGQPRPLLSELTPSDHGRKCLVLDLDETLLHSSFKLVHSPDFIVPVEIENQLHNVYVLKRPGVDAFMKRMGEIYEVVIFTASLSKYADPVLDKLDIHQVVKHRLFRESCYNHKGNYVKDLSQLGRPIGETIIIDNSPASYIFHPNNAVPVSSWFNDPHDTELTDLQHFLTDLAEVQDVRGVLDGGLYPGISVV